MTTTGNGTGTSHGGGRNQDERPLRIGSLLFDGLDQIDLTGPFEVFAQLSNSTYQLYGTSLEPVRDGHGLTLRADATLDQAPQLDLLHVPGGAGQEALMDDEAVLNWIRHQAAGARCVFSVCTGALVLGAAGLLVGRRATTHWASLHLLPYFGATPVPDRVVFDGDFVFSGGVTAGIDGALSVAAQLRGEREAMAIQLLMQYAPEPPFSAGTPATAPADVLDAATAKVAPLTARREVTAKRISAQLGVEV